MGPTKATDHECNIANVMKSNIPVKHPALELERDTPPKLNQRTKQMREAPREEEQIAHHAYNQVRHAKMCLDKSARKARVNWKRRSASPS